MPSKHPELLAEQLRIIDELSVLKDEETAAAIKLGKIRSRKIELRERNNEICWLMSPEKKRGTVTEVDFRNRLRHRIRYRSWGDDADPKKDRPLRAI